MGEMLAVLALLLFSLNIIVTKIGSSRINRASGFFIAMLVNIIFGSILFSIQLLSSGDSVSWNSRGFLIFLLAGFFSTYIGRRLFFETIAKLGPAKASAFQVSNPLFTVIIAYIFLNENLNVVTLLAILIVLIGLILISYVPINLRPLKVKNKNQDIKKFDKYKVFFLSGISLAIISGLSYAIGNVLRGMAIREWNEPILGSIIGASLGALIQLLLNKDARAVFVKIKTFDRKGVYAYMASGILTISAQSSVIASMFYIPVSIANLITLSTPIIVTPVSYFVFKNQEGITRRTMAGIFLVLIGISVIVATQ